MKLLNVYLRREENTLEMLFSINLKKDVSNVTQGDEIFQDFNGTDECPLMSFSFNDDGFHEILVKFIGKENLNDIRSSNN
jgi:hypothetical protein